IGVLLSLPALILLFLFVQEKNKSVYYAEQERVGNGYLRPVRKILETVPQFQRGGLKDTAARVDEAFAELEALTAERGEQLGTNEKFNSFRSRWQELKRGWENSAPEKRQEMYRATMQEALDMFSLVGYTSRMILDPDVEGYFMADTLLVGLPEQVKLLSEITQLTDRVVATKTVSADEKLQLSLWLSLLETNTANINADYLQAQAGRSSQTLRVLELALKKHNDSLGIYTSMLRQKILQAKDEELQFISTSHFNSIAGTTMTSGSNIWLEFADSSDSLLAARIYNSTLEKYVALGAFLLAGLLVGLFAWLTVKKIVRSLDEAVEISDKVSRGEIVTVIAGERNDEIGQLHQSMERMTIYLKEMAETADRIADGNLSEQVIPKSPQDRFGNSFQNMISRTLGLVQSQDERDRLQNAIMKLLSEVADVASGDLTAQAEVTPDMTGAIADAFNFMIEELRSIISQVQTTTFQVGSSAEEVQTATENLAQRSENQSIQLEEVSSAIEQMVSSVQKIAESVTLSVQVADQSLENARKGTNAVQNNIMAMNRLRDQATGTATRIRKLGERSEEIAGIVKLIDDVARRANILALNATIQATAAGEKGRGFIVVAEEVERLAVRSQDATRAITALTQAIQGETSEAVSSIEETLREVSAGARIASEVGRAVEEIESVSNRLSELSHVVLSASQEQAEGSESIHRAMRDIAAIAQQTAFGMRESASTVNKLALSARELRTSLASFKLPEQTGENGAGNYSPIEPSLN
ncbi:MAG TPA: methyl-accepting chemotaxis protein, partial [Pyrinomonadaceae bacterium]|nr:methyl-accepting chemotaxis protein [Pyrinomonadaceae bacterium]